MKLVLTYHVQATVEVGDQLLKGLDALHAKDVELIERLVGALSGHEDVGAHLVDWWPQPELDAVPV
jgi:hypothetical protein